MIKSLLLGAAAAALAAASGAVAAAQDGAAPPADAPSAAEQLIANCSAHKFETSIQTAKGGKPHTSKVKLCGKAGQTDADWLVTLKDALQTVETNPKMSAEVKTQIAAGLKSEIARVEASMPPVTAPVPPDLAPATAAVVPAPAPAPVSVPVPAPVSVSGAIAAPAKPRLSFECYTPGDIGAGGPCTALTRDTRITVRADQPLAAGYGLRFVARGEAQADLALQPMAKGRTVRVQLPSRVCSGGGGSNVEIRIVSGATVLDARGPYILRC